MAHPPRPKGFPASPTPPDVVAAEVKEARAADIPFASGRILGSMCTEPHPAARAAFETFFETNLGDPDWCRGAQHLEALAKSMILDLLSAPPEADGLFLSGGSEANLTALRLARVLRGGREVVLPKTAHFSFDKAIQALGLRAVPVPVTDGFVVDPDEVRRRVTPETCAVVGIAGTTELGTVDPIPELSGVALETQVALHVDAAFGGFVIPFLAAGSPGKVPFDFALPGVTSLAIDPHKMGMAPVPCGFLGVRKTSHLERIGVATPYISTESQASIVGTRPGAASAGAYAAMSALGREGYERIVADCMENARYLSGELRAMGLVVPVDPVLNVVAFRVKHPRSVKKALRERGWSLSEAPIVGGLRIVCMPHVRRENLRAFLSDLSALLRVEGGIRG
ncbi:MAG: tyrosine decarboxylase MfnA [Methanobacteriota archaeon]